MIAHSAPLMQRVSEHAVLNSERDNSGMKAKWMSVQMLEKPLEGSCGKHLLQELMSMLPEHFDENLKAVTLIGTCLGDMIQSKQNTPSEVCFCFFLLSCA
jgi:hypothetical protein